MVYDVFFLLSLANHSIGTYHVTFTWMFFFHEVLLSHFSFVLMNAPPVGSISNQLFILEQNVIDVF